MGFQPTTLCDLVETLVSKCHFEGLDWYCMMQLHSQVMTCTQELINSITLSH